MSFAGAVGEIVTKYEAGRWEVVKVAVDNYPAFREAVVYAINPSGRKMAKVGRLEYSRSTKKQCFEEFFLNVDDLEEVARAAGCKRLQLDIEFLKLGGREV